jgi:hypothetical protein
MRETKGNRQRGNQGNYRNRMRENRETHDVVLIKLWERVRDLQCKSWGTVGFFFIYNYIIFVISVINYVFNNIMKSNVIQL